MTPPNSHPASVDATWNKPYTTGASFSSGYAPTPYFHGHHCPHFGGWDIHGMPTCVQYSVPAVPPVYPHPVYASYGYYTAPVPAFVVTPPMPPASQGHHGASQLSASFNSVESLSSGTSPDRKRGAKKGRVPCGQCFEERIKYSGKVRAFKGMLHCCYRELASVLNLFYPPGRIVETIKNQNGSRFIQQKLLTADKEEVQLIFDEAMKDFDGTCLTHGRSLLIF